jgi:very-short-patch-repair endonuclease
MLNHNPMKRADVRAKVSNSLKAIGHKPVEQGGNGKEMPKAEQALMQMLSAFGFVHQYAIKTGLRTHGYPTCYKPDAANPILKIAVEADGASHKALVRQAQDLKKDTFLKCSGWTVLRFTNEEILTNPTTVMFTILKSINSILTSQTE